MTPTVPPPQEEEIMDTIYDTFDIQIPQASPEWRQSKRKAEVPGSYRFES